MRISGTATDSWRSPSVGLLLAFDLSNAVRVTARAMLREVRLITVLSSTQMIFLGALCWVLRWLRVRDRWRDR